VLINLKGDILGSAGDLQPWLLHREKESI
jgi:cobalt-precorrin-5B (C1)-methyltransferase